MEAKPQTNSNASSGEENPRTDVASSDRPRSDTSFYYDANNVIDEESSAGDQVEALSADVGLMYLNDEQVAQSKETDQPQGAEGGSKIPGDSSAQIQDTQSNETNHSKACQEPGCNGEVYAGCGICLRMLCHEHHIGSLQNAHNEHCEGRPLLLSATPLKNNAVAKLQAADESKRTEEDKDFSNTPEKKGYR